MAKKLINTNIKLGKGTLLREAVYDVLDEPTFHVITESKTDNTDGAGFVSVGTYANRAVNVFGFIQSFDGKTNLDLRYYHLIPVRNGNEIFFKVESTNGTSVIQKPITFVFTIIY